MTEPLIVQFPLRGQWRVMQPPGHAQSAFDLLAVEGEKQEYVSTTYLPWILGMQPLEEWHGWGQPVYAPFDSVVVQEHDGVPDRTPINLIKDMLFTILPISLFAPRGVDADLSRFAGNYVLLQSGPVYALLAHFRLHSLKVQPGQIIKAGEQLGQIGNSGNSLVPHLHFQLSDGPNLFTAKSIPFRVRQFDRWTGQAWSSTREKAIAAGDIIRVSDKR